MSVRRRVLSGSAWTLASHGGAAAIRFARNLVLTRLLYPEAFGLMAIVWTLMYGLEMLSDTGVGAAIVRERDAEAPDFLNTAWTVQAIRGGALWLLASFLAWPMAELYAQPQLLVLVPVAALSAVISGFISTSHHLCRRRMDLRRLTLLELGVELLALGVTAAWAAVAPGVWALVAGALAGRALFCAGSHLLLPGIPQRFRWHRDSLRRLLGFGRWVLLSSALYFLGAQGDRLLLARLLDLAQLGVYSIAAMLAETVNGLIIRLNHGVLYPAYGAVLREEPARLRGVYYRARLALDAFVLAPLAALMMLGDRVVELLYDPRYHAAGWMFQLLCVRLIMVTALSSSEACLIALGKPQYGAAQNAGRAAWIVAGIPAGWHFLGLEGVMIAIALSELPALAILWTGLARERVLSVALELRSVPFAAAGAALGYGLAAAAA